MKLDIVMAALAEHGLVVKAKAQTGDTEEISTLEVKEVKGTEHKLLMTAYLVREEIIMVEKVEEPVAAAGTVVLVAVLAAEMHRAPEDPLGHGATNLQDLLLIPMVMQVNMHQEQE